MRELPRPSTSIEWDISQAFFVAGQAVFGKALRARQCAGALVNPRRAYINDSIRNGARPLALDFPQSHPPAPGEISEVAEGVLWLRLPLPFRLDHVNVYLIEDGAGFALLDTGIDDEPTRALWERLLAGLLKDKPLTRIISSHCHPDHIGLAGWLNQRLGIELYASQTEYLETLTVSLDPQALNAEPYRSFYRGHGLDAAQTDLILSRGLHYLRMVSPLPRTFNRLMADETLEIGGRRFDILTGGGHSSEQVMLYCRDGGFVLSADQAMAKISPNISVEAIDPHGDPLGAYLRSLASLKQVLPPDTLALPGHNLPFIGLPERIDELIAHHRQRCDAVLKAIGAGEATAAELVPVVFGRRIDDPHQMSFAFGEALAHVNYLVRRKALAIRPGRNGGWTLAAA
jgi:glyoxylase-like metal-dependent hydrolase (beta-lactamase superfamily II)